VWERETVIDCISRGLRVDIYVHINICIHTHTFVCVCTSLQLEWSHRVGDTYVPYTEDNLQWCQALRWIASRSELFALQLLTSPITCPGPEIAVWRHQNNEAGTFILTHSRTCRYEDTAKFQHRLKVTTFLETEARGTTGQRCTRREGFHTWSLLLAAMILSSVTIGSMLESPFPAAGKGDYISCEDAWAAKTAGRTRDGESCLWEQTMGVMCASRASLIVSLLLHEKIWKWRPNSLTGWKIAQL